MTDYSVKGDLASRDIAARSIVFEMEKTGEEEVFLDVTHFPRGSVATRFPQIYRVCSEHDLDITRVLIPVAPAAHYTVGGVRVNSWGETTVKGLFAAGETACTGVHGANRLASNSLLEVLVFSRRIIERTQGSANKDAPYAAGNNIVYHSLSKPGTDGSAAPSLPTLQQLLWEKAGIIRHSDGLTEAIEGLATWQQSLPSAEDRSSYELKNLVILGRMLAEAALLREESRGAHFRSDFPRRSTAWQKHIVFKAA
jgi:L-aspartate oxidase